MTKTTQFIQFFHQVAPYINQHRNKVFVFCIQDSATTQRVLKSLLHDIAILHSLRVRVIIVYGVRHSLNQRLQGQQFFQGRRITDAKAMQTIQAVIGATGIRVEAMLSMGLANSPMQGARVCTSSGNFIIAKPMGVRDGVDFGLTGEIRKVRGEPINERLQSDNIVLIPPLGYSNTGEVFNLTAEEVAAAVAKEIQADKLLFFSDEIEQVVSKEENGKAITSKQAQTLANKVDSELLKTTLQAAIKACEWGINRVHLVSQETDGAVLVELYTRDGVGLMITDQSYDRIEQATIDDISSLLQLIRPLEKQGILVRRSRELLEMEIEHFSLLKRDNTVIGCSALYPYLSEDMAELGCLVVDKEYQKNGLADVLLQHTENNAKAMGVKRLFCLTTHTSHWFMERGFTEAQLADLPKKKQAFYNFSRNSKPYIKSL